MACIHSYMVCFTMSMGIFSWFENGQNTYQFRLMSQITTFS